MQLSHFTRQVEREYPNSDLSKEALDIRAKLEKSLEFETSKEVEARKAEFTEKQKAAEAKEDAKNKLKISKKRIKLKSIVQKLVPRTRCYFQD